MIPPRENRYDDKDTEQLREDIEDALKDDDYERVEDLRGDEEDDN